MLVAALGFTVVGAGVAMLALPGPGVVVIIVGLAIRATEIAWAERAARQDHGPRDVSGRSGHGQRRGSGHARADRGAALIGVGVVMLVAERFDDRQTAGAA